MAYRASESLQWTLQFHVLTLKGNFGHRILSAARPLETFSELSYIPRGYVNASLKLCNIHNKLFIFSLQVNNEIREEFRKNQNIFDTSEMKPGPTGSGPEVGKKWHNILHRYLNNSSSQSEEEAEIGESVIKALRKNLPEFNFLQSEFPLYGYANKKEKLVVSFWNGKADAIGWYKDNYVIVDWKAVGILDFWKKDKHAYGDYLHQCLVYARLLMLHLDLQRLPYILIVPINNISGNQIHPGMFWDFPDKCKSKLDEWEWTVIPKKTLKLPRSMVVDNLKEDIGNMAVVKVFKGECTLNQMLEALGLDEVKIEIEDR